MDDLRLELYWYDIPTEKNKAVTYPDLITLWNRSAREVRKILHYLSLFDNGDNFVLIRSGSGKGFYKTDDEETLKAYKKECLNKGKSVFAPVKKINRVLNANADQYSIENNLRLFREKAGLKQAEVCRKLSQFDRSLDTALLSKMENGVCLPTPYQLAVLADIYGCKPSDLINLDFETR